MFTLLSKNKKFVDVTKDLNMQDLRKNNPQYLVLHSTYRPTFEDVQRNHKFRRFAGVGYHIFVSSDSKTYKTRPFDIEGAHALGFNTKSISLCFYTNNGSPSKEILNRTCELIDGIKEQHSGIELISHTQAQLMYLNDLLSQSNFSKQFPIQNDVTNSYVFNEIKAESELFMNFLNESNQKIASQLKKIKNCPGEAYKYFI